MSDLWDGVGVDRRIEGGDLRACYDQNLALLSFGNIPQKASHK